MAAAHEINCKNKFPFTITPVDASTNEQLMHDFKGQRDGFVQVGPKKYLFPSAFMKHAEQLYNFEARPNDVWVATCPRSGTTMTQELIWLIVNDFDYDRAHREPLTKRFPLLEYCILMHDELKEKCMHAHRNIAAIQNNIEGLFAPSYETFAHAESPRFIKTHLPFSLLPPSVMKTKAKVIYVARHPKDVAVSWYHLNRLFKYFDFVKDFSQFWNYFENGLTIWSPYWEHLEEGWAHRDEPNVLFIFYEDLIRDLPSNIQKIAAFLNKQIKEDDIQRLAEHLQIDNFRNNRAINRSEYADCGLSNSNESSFIRKGKVTVNGWQEEYTPELAAQAQAWIENHLRQTTLKFPEF